MLNPVTNFCLFMDGNAWCAVGPGFVDIASSPCGFGATKDEAVRNFQKAWRRPRESNKPDLTVAQFWECADNPLVLANP